MNPFDASKWIRISLVSLLIVAALGVLMRYKIGFEFQWFSQANLQHAHSHFAFAGWVSQTLMVLMIGTIQQSLSPARLARYQQILWSNLITAFGMLVAFSIQGYAFFSILFSTTSIFIAFYFSIQFFEDLSKASDVKQKHWFVAALVCILLSALGTFALVYMMVTKNIPQHPYLASVYWYLHFQYNGWFFFASMGLFIDYITKKTGIQVPIAVFWLFAASCIPAYGLSVLWLNLPVWLYTFVVLASIAQFFGWIILLSHFRKHNLIKHANIQGVARLLCIYLAVALTIKLSLQLVSVIPAISKLAFGFRPIVIAYLHLVLLAITSVYLLTYAYVNRLIPNTRKTNIGLLIIVGGILLNETALAVQGIASFSYTIIPAINIMLFLIAIVIFIGLLWLNISQKRSDSGIV